MDISNWFDLASHGERLAAVRVTPCDRNYLLRRFVDWGQQMCLPVYFLNPGYGRLQLVQFDPAQADGIALSTVPIELDAISLAAVVKLEAGGIFILEGLVGEAMPNFQLRYLISNAHYDLNQLGLEQYIVLVDDFEVPLNLHALLPQFEYPLPSRGQVQTKVRAFCAQYLPALDVEAQRPLVQSCIGLPDGEIDRILQRVIGRDCQPDAITQAVLEYKREKLRGRGIVLPPKPDVQVAAGMELLDETMEKIRLLLQPEAESRNLRPPRAMLLWGIPGSGKSLAAKLAAQRIGGTLVTCDWNGLVGSNVRESMDNLNYLLTYVNEIGTSILFFDEFEKAFTGWRSDGESGVLSKLAGRLLSWMQDHIEPVVMIATINHLDMLPAEMLRRFDYIHFFGMPHAGALYEVFNVHLPRYFRYDFSELEWRILLREYRGCTPDEVAKAIHRVAHKIYFQDMNAPDFQPQLPQLAIEDLIEERKDFTPASSQQSVSDQIAAILNKARYAKPVAGKDRSIFSTPPQNFLGLDETARPEEKRYPLLSVRRTCPTVEEI